MDGVGSETNSVTPAAAATDEERAAIRAATAADLPAVIALDAEITGLAKPDYWSDLFDRFGARDRGRYFLVADVDGAVAGFIIGELRAWEFGSPPCGWVFAINVKPGIRLGGIATALLEAICDGFRDAGVNKVRTMLRRDAQLIMSFFRSQGMMAGPFIQLEKDLDP